MPLYEYQCQSCGKKFEVIQKFSDEPVKVHADCGGQAVKLFSAPAFHLKGTGWYATDYAKKGASSATKNEDSKGDSKGTDSKGTDSKPAGESSSSSGTEKAGTESKPASTETKPAPAPASESK
jgi:putative FmdB family regulatory protein